MTKSEINLIQEEFHESMSFFQGRRKKRPTYSKVKHQPTCSTAYISQKLAEGYICKFSEVNSYFEIFVLKSLAIVVTY